MLLKSVVELQTRNANWVWRLAKQLPRSHTVSSVPMTGSVASRFNGSIAIYFTIYDHCNVSVRNRNQIVKSFNVFSHWQKVWQCQLGSAADL